MRFLTGELKNIMRTYFYAHSTSVTFIFTQAKRNNVREINKVFHILIINFPITCKMMPMMAKPN